MTHTQDSPKQPTAVCTQKASKKFRALDPAKDQAPAQEAQCDIVDPGAAEVPARQPQQASQPQEASTDKVSTLSSFLQSCMKLLRNQNALKELQKVLAVIDPQRGFDQEKTVSHVRRTGREMRLNVQIGEYDMTDVILDLGSEVNVLPKQTWGQMGNLPWLGHLSN